jgi:hypothetical protein
MAQNKTKSAKTGRALSALKTVAFKITAEHKAAIEAACAEESKKIGRKYGLAEYFRDSALAYAGKSFTIADHEYKRGRPSKAAA